MPRSRSRSRSRALDTDFTDSKQILVTEKLRMDDEKLAIILNETFYRAVNIMKTGKYGNNQK